MEDFILIIIMLKQSDEGFGSGKKHVLDICTKSYANGLGSIKSAFLFNLKTVYTARWLLFATSDKP